MEVKGKLVELVSPYSIIKPQDLGKNETLSGLTFKEEGKLEYLLSQGYTKVGYAEITFIPSEPKDLIDNKVAALRQEAATIRAEATAKCTRIEGQIQNLLSIGYDGADIFKKPTEELDIPF